MLRPALELADIVRQHGPGLSRRQRLSRAQLRVLRAIGICRTAALGGHVKQCDRCQYSHVFHHSCRNRHCPKCQPLARARWLEQRKAELLPVPYFHVVFTLPAPLAEIAFQNKRAVYNILFRTVAATLLSIAADPRHLGAELGFFSVLHTWGQNLQHHPHIHCVIPGGGLTPGGTEWKACRPGFFLSVRVLSRLFRRLFLEALERAFRRGELKFYSALKPLAQRDGFLRHLQPWRTAEWVVYAKPAFAGPAAVIEYLGQYTHRVAISNQRLVECKDGQVTFRYQDRRVSGREKHKQMTLEAGEFLRRYLLHVLPDGLQRIRYYGWLSNRGRTAQLALCRERLQVPMDPLLPSAAKLTWSDLLAKLSGAPPDRCPRCRTGVMRVTEVLRPIRYGIDSS